MNCPHASSMDVDSAVRAATPEDRSSLPLPPGRKGRFRCLLPWLLFQPSFAERLQRRYGDVAAFRLPWKDCCLVCDPELAAGILAKENRLFLQGLARVRMPRIPNWGLQGQHGEERRWRWEILRPAFTPEALDVHEDVFVERALAMQERWRDGDVIDIEEEAMRFAGAATVGMAFGRDMALPPDIAFDARRALKWELIFNNLPIRPALLRKLLPLRFFREGDRLLEEFDDWIERAVERSREPSFEGRDLITWMVRGKTEDGRRFAPDELHDELYFIVSGAVGPTATVVSWCAHYLAENPVARERLEREADEVLGGQPIAPFDQKRLPFAHAVLKEALRLAPTAAFNNKDATTDCVVGDYFIPKGTRMIPASSLVHRSAEHFEKPLEFRPERWLEGLESELPPHAYFPYGFGYRRCLGDEYAARLAVYCLASMAQRWRLNPVSRRPVRPKYVVIGPYNKWGRWRMRLSRRPGVGR